MRAFVGIPLPLEIGKRLEEVSRRLRERGYNVKPVKAENMHITLLFLGNVDEGVAERFSFPFQPFRLTVKGLGAFPSPSYARVVWAGVGEGEKVRELAEKVWGIFWRDERFHPHVTIARLRRQRGVEDIVREFGREEWGSFDVKEVALYRSTLRRDGPIYEKVKVVRGVD